MDQALQAAIYNSLQSSSGGGGRSSGGGGRSFGGGGGRRSDLAPSAPPRSRPSQRVSSRDVASAAHARAAGRIGGGAGGVGSGGAGAFGAAPPPRSALAREGITPSSTKGPSKPERKALPAPAAEAPTEEPALDSNEPPPRTPFTGGDPTLVAAIEGEMMQTAPAVDWDDVGGLDEAKRLLKEAAVLPLLIPDFFTGIREPWKGVLLFGPPGTGKTMLAKAVAATGKCAFFACSPAALLSKFHGESEKLARTLFAVARHHAPSVLFFDEIDALLSTRGAANEHEASRRLKSELLTLIDGVNTGGGEGGKIVLVLAATNKPWDLDEAMRRRLERRIHIPLPDASAREAILRLNLASLKLADDVDVAALAARADGYSGADLHLVCRDASLMTMRKAVEGRTPDEIVALQAAGQLEGEVSSDDFAEALRRTAPSVAAEELGRFASWDEEFGCKEAS